MLQNFGLPDQAAALGMIKEQVENNQTALNQVGYALLGQAGKTIQQNFKGLDNTYATIERRLNNTVNNNGVNLDTIGEMIRNQLVTRAQVNQANLNYAQSGVIQPTTQQRIQQGPFVLSREKYVPFRVNAPGRTPPYYCVCASLTQVNTSPPSYGTVIGPQFDSIPECNAWLAANPCGPGAPPPVIQPPPIGQPPPPPTQYYCIKTDIGGTAVYQSPPPPQPSRIVSGPYDTLEQADAACQQAPPPPPPGECQWFCVDFSKTSTPDPRCLQATPAGIQAACLKIISGPYEQEIDCVHACKQCQQQTEAQPPPEQPPSEQPPEQLPEVSLAPSTVPAPTMPDYCSRLKTVEQIAIDIGSQILGDKGISGRAIVSLVQATLNDGGRVSNDIKDELSAALQFVDFENTESMWNLAVGGLQVGDNNKLRSIIACRNVLEYLSRYSVEFGYASSLATGRGTSLVLGVG